MHKIKQFVESDRGKDILTVIIVILVGLSSFGLGRLSKNTSSGIKIEYSDQSATQSANVISTVNNTPNTDTNILGKNFFASSRGSKYYPVECSAGKTIKQENRIYFETREEAEGAGYMLSASCR